MRDTNVRPTTSGRPSPLVQLRVTGWTKSRLAGSSDGGVSALIKFLERRATIAQNKNAESKGTKKEGDAVIIFVPTDDVKSILSANGYEWSGVNVHIELLTPSGPRSENKFSVIFREVLTRRYIPDQKCLMLNQICADPQLQALGIGATLGRRSKLFEAMMVVVDQVWTSREEKKEKIHFLSLQSNDLEDLAGVTSVAQAFPDLLNLDLSANKLSTLRSISRWQNKFRHLEQIVLTGNPMEQNEPELLQELLKWYPKLYQYNLQPVPAPLLEAARAKKTPPKVQAGKFEDAAGIAEKFLLNFYKGYDSDRNALAEYYYDSTSQFSMDVNTHALRDSSQKRDPCEWEAYIRHSRNLNKITNITARMRRNHKGTAAITEMWNQLPATRHPDFATEPQKWLLECRTQPMVPDPSGANPGGVNGLIITVHGEFQEVATNKLRSFDRTFILGPGATPSGIRVVNDMITIRAYGGTKAFEVEPAAAIDSEAAEKQQLIFQLMQATGMNSEYALLCLTQSNFDLQQAMVAFEGAKANLPAEAFVQ
ncbi:NTF2-like protein [Tothia fuscella]|uniref:NTF2-like protein n=1 Tax=Tothia fuscella TaxID=1048955 RepID=A0A9P4NWY7_9PEZI|nr:NTF2-like protein [Tothia fuscella]